MRKIHLLVNRSQPTAGGNKEVEATKAPPPCLRLHVLVYQYDYYTVLFTSAPSTVRYYSGVVVFVVSALYFMMVGCVCCACCVAIPSILDTSPHKPLSITTRSV